MPENLYPHLLTAPSMNQESLRWSGNIIKTFRTLRKNILKSNENVRMLTIDYYIHRQVQALLL